jgi:hypothetical protein
VIVKEYEENLYKMNFTKPHRQTHNNKEKYEGGMARP